MLKIFKYILEVTDFQSLKIPEPAKVLSVAEQKGRIVLYAIVDDSEGVIKKSIHVSIVGTGNPLSPYIEEETYRFLGTVSMYGGDLMWHVFVKD